MSTLIQSRYPLIAFGLLVGIIAGIFFSVSQVLLTIALGGGPFDYLRVIASLVLGPDALSPTVSLPIAILVGVLTRLTLASVFGIVFVVILDAARQLHAAPLLLLVFGSVYGFGLWIVNFLVLAPAIAPQFAMVDQFWIGFFAHTFLYGTILGGCVAALRRTMLSTNDPNP